MYITVCYKLLHYLKFYANSITCNFSKSSSSDVHLKKDNEIELNPLTSFDFTVSSENTSEFFDTINVCEVYCINQVLSIPIKDISSKNDFHFPIE